MGYPSFETVDKKCEIVNSFNFTKIEWRLTEVLSYEGTIGATHFRRVEVFDLYYTAIFRSFHFVVLICSLRIVR